MSPFLAKKHKQKPGESVFDVGIICNLLQLDWRVQSRQGSFMQMITLGGAVHVLGRCSSCAYRVSWHSSCSGPYGIVDLRKERMGDFSRDLRQALPLLSCWSCMVCSVTQEWVLHSCQGGVRLVHVILMDYSYSTLGRSCGQKLQQDRSDTKELLLNLERDWRSKEMCFLGNSRYYFLECSLLYS